MKAIRHDSTGVFHLQKQRLSHGRAVTFCERTFLVEQRKDVIIAEICAECLAGKGDESLVVSAWKFRK